MKISLKRINPVKFSLQILRPPMRRRVPPSEGQVTNLHLSQTQLCQNHVARCSASGVHSNNENQQVDRGAYCQKYLCSWPDDDELHVATCFVSLQQLDKFLMAVIADAKDDLITDLGHMLMIPERNFNFKDQISFARGAATISLATGDHKKAYRSAEHLQAAMEKVKRRNSL